MFKVRNKGLDDVSNLSQLIKTRLAFDEKRLPPPYDMGGDNTDESAVFRLGAQAEHARLQPLFEQLIAVATTADRFNDCVAELGNNPHCCDETFQLMHDALTALRDSLGEG